MRKVYACILAILIYACQDQEQTPNSEDPVKPATIGSDSTSRVKETDKEKDTIPVRYANARFKDVTVENTGPGQYRVQGKGQIFEANFGWLVEDGHEELKLGNQMTDAGAPEWGNFDFNINVQKKRPNSTLTLVLFETSAKDGSRQYELPITLY